ncbi:MAG: hypothetical protein ACYTFU_12890 [Planctomycetota bacterium]|jgi:hypothetical protein
MDKYIGLDMDCKKTVGYAIVPGKKESSATLGPDIESIRRYFRQERQGGYRIHAAFEISGQAGFLYDQLLEDVDSLHVVNPTKMTWIYRTAKKNDRIDARKMAVLLSIGELPKDRSKSRTGQKPDSSRLEVRRPSQTGPCRQLVEACQSCVDASTL